MEREKVSERHFPALYFLFPLKWLARNESIGSGRVLFQCMRCQVIFLGRLSTAVRVSVLSVRAVLLLPLIVISLRFPLSLTTPYFCSVLRITDQARPVAPIPSCVGAPPYLSAAAAEPMSAELISCSARVRGHESHVRRVHTSVDCVCARLCNTCVFERRS
jgi:hypothetical protein